MSLSTLRHRGAGSPHNRTLSSGHHALVVGHVTALKASPCGIYAVLVILSPLWSCGSGGPVHVVLMVY